MDMFSTGFDTARVDLQLGRKSLEFEITRNHTIISNRDLLNTGCGSCSNQICFDFSVDEILQQALKMLN